MAAKAILILCAQALLTQVCDTNGAISPIREPSLQPIVVNFGYMPILPGLPPKLGPDGPQSLLKIPESNLCHQTFSDDCPLVSKISHGQCSLSQRVSRGVGAGSPLGGQGLSYPGYMADPMMPEPWTRPIRSDIYGPSNPAMDFGASSIMPPFESPGPYVGGDMPYLMDGMNLGYNMPLITPMPMVPEMPMRFDPMPMMPEPFPMDPFPMYPEIPIIMEPMPPMISDPMIMEPMYPMIDPMPMDPMYQMIPDVMYPMIPEPNCPIVTDPVCPMPMPAEECIAPARGSPTIAPCASLSVVVMDSSIQNLFENLWNVQQ